MEPSETNAGPWPPGEGKARRPLAAGGRAGDAPPAPGTPPALHTEPGCRNGGAGEPELRGVSDVLRLALGFLPLLVDNR